MHHRRHYHSVSDARNRQRQGDEEDHNEQQRLAERSSSRPHAAFEGSPAPAPHQQQQPRGSFPSAPLSTFLHSPSSGNALDHVTLPRIISPPESRGQQLNADLARDSALHHSSRDEDARHRLASFRHEADARKDAGAFNHGHSSRWAVGAGSPLLHDHQRLPAHEERASSNREARDGYGAGSRRREPNVEASRAFSASRGSDTQLRSNASDLRDAASSIAAKPTMTNRTVEATRAASSDVSAPVQRGPRGSYAARTCTQCRKRKAKCNLPEEVLLADIVSTTEPLPEHMRCVRCANMNLSCLVYEKNARGKRKRIVDVEQDKKRNTNKKSGASTRRTSVVPLVLPEDDGDSVSLEEDEDESQVEIRSPNRFQATVSAHRNPAKNPSPREMLNASSGKEVQQSSANAQAQARTNPLSGSLTLDGRDAARASQNLVSSAQVKSDGMNISSHKRSPSPTTRASVEQLQIFLPNNISPGFTAGAQLAMRPLSLLAQYLVKNKSFATKQKFETDWTGEAQTLEAEQDFPDVLDIVSEKLSRRLTPWANAYILWHPHLPTLSELRTRHSSTPTTSSSLLLSLLYLLTLPRLEPQPSSPGKTSHILVLLSAAVRRDVTLVMMGTRPDILSVQALELLSAHAPLAPLERLSRRAPRSPEPFTGRGLLVVAQRIAQALNLPAAPARAAEMLASHFSASREMSERARRDSASRRRNERRRKSTDEDSDASSEDMDANESADEDREEEQDETSGKRACVPEQGAPSSTAQKQAMHEAIVWHSLACWSAAMAFDDEMVSPPASLLTDPNDEFELHSEPGASTDEIESLRNAGRVVMRSRFLTLKQLYDKWRKMDGSMNRQEAKRSSSERTSFATRALMEFNTDLKEADAQTKRDLAPFLESRSVDVLVRWLSIDQQQRQYLLLSMAFIYVIYGRPVSEWHMTGPIDILRQVHGNPSTGKFCRERSNLHGEQIQRILSAFTDLACLGHTSDNTASRQPRSESKHQKDSAARRFVSAQRSRGSSSLTVDGSVSSEAETDEEETSVGELQVGAAHAVGAIPVMWTCASIVNVAKGEVEKRAATLMGWRAMNPGAGVQIALLRLTARCLREMEPRVRRGDLSSDEACKMGSVWAAAAGLISDAAQSIADWKGLIESNHIQRSKNFIVAPPNANGAESKDSAAATDKHGQDANTSRKAALPALPLFGLGPSSGVPPSHAGGAASANHHNVGSSVPSSGMMSGGFDPFPPGLGFGLGGEGVNSLLAGGGLMTDLMMSSAAGWGLGGAMTNAGAGDTGNTSQADVISAMMSTSNGGGGLNALANFFNGGAGAQGGFSANSQAASSALTGRHQQANAEGNGASGVQSWSDMLAIFGGDDESLARSTNPNAPFDWATFAGWKAEDGTDR
ncbi:Zn(2)-C6 fungal-type DNA-binding domain [Ceraceosorus bombacis]|uniref:Zn(2)-C6 fungal-type DNA-binding domain n=1 Tax=Ceraceosorus bombacis TaxID=401625 RepID=A0A0P1BR30_9BASI|nr:Zn(2)-C6 fungal-type DNA-binding domain [Ceraceosorus bombacis]